MALDRAHHRLFIPAYGNGGYRAFQLDGSGLPADRSAMYVIGRESLFGRRSNPVPSEYELNFPGAITVFDSSTQRLFGIDRFNNRILVFRADPDEIEKYPAASVVIGQKDFASTERGVGRRRTGMMASGVLDEKGQRLFVADPPNNRVLVFDVHPDRLDSDPAATVVIGQSDFQSRRGGVGPDKLSGPSSVAYDPVFERLFVSDMGNHRVMVFDVASERLANGPRAIAVMGQPDFESRAPRRSLDELKPESLAYDWVHHRLFIAEDLQHRVMAYDAHPDRVGGPTKAIAVIGQPDAFSTHPAVSENRIAMPRLAVEPETQKLYISEGFPAGNRISIFDITPGKLHTGMVASDVVGHETPSGGPDFDARMAQGHLSGRTLAAARAVALDPADHRLFVADEYNHRVVVWNLDSLNRVDDRSAAWVLGQPDLESSFMGEPSASNLTVPLAVAYEARTKRLFVGDGYHNRILVYEAAPGRLASGMDASVVIGQRDFESVEAGAGRDRLRFGVRMRRGIASNFIPMGLAVDASRQRLFVSDGENNRVLVFDVARDRLETGAPAIAVLGQPDFESTSPGGGDRGLKDPGHLAYDPERERLFVVDSGNKRVLVFEASPQAFKPGASARFVLGQPGFAGGAPSPGPRAMGASAPAKFDDASFLAPNGIALDAEHELLYVTDSVVPADRILVFDVSTERLRNGAKAIAILGASGAEPATRRFFGGPKSFPGQYTVRDARGIAVDPDNGRLFVTGSFASRVVVFHFPRAAWRYDVAANDLQYFHTPDAVDLGARREASTSRAGVLVADGAPVRGTAIFSRSEMFVDERTQRHSRMLVSEAAFPAMEPLTRSAYFVDGADNREHFLYVRNGGGAPTTVELVLKDAKGEERGRWKRSVAAFAREVFGIEALASDVPDSGTLVLEAGSPVSVVAMRSSRNARGERLLAPVPRARIAPQVSRQVVPWIVNGAGRQSDLVLVNDSDEVLRGDIAFFDAQGERAPLGMASELAPYALPPETSLRLTSDGAGPRAVPGYAVVTPQGEGAAAPFVAAFVRVRAGDVFTSESLVSANEARTARFAVNTEKTLIRHGVIETLVHVTNPSGGAAHVVAGMGRGDSVARTLMAGEQTTISFGEGLRGVLTVESDVAVSTSAHQRTVNLRGEVIDLELPPLGPGTSFPYVGSGEGISTELRLSNPSPARLGGTLELVSPTGEPARSAILR